MRSKVAKLGKKLNSSNLNFVNQSWDCSSRMDPKKYLSTSTHRIFTIVTHIKWKRMIFTIVTHIKSKAHSSHNCQHLLWNQEEEPPVQQLRHHEYERYRQPSSPNIVKLHWKWQAWHSKSSWFPEVFLQRGGRCYHRASLCKFPVTAGGRRCWKTWWDNNGRVQAQQTKKRKEKQVVMFTNPITGERLRLLPRVPLW